MYTKVNYLIYDGAILEETAWCSIPFNEENIGSLYMMLATTLVYFLVPMITVSVLYVRLATGDIDAYYHIIHAKVCSVLHLVTVRMTHKQNKLD